MKRVFVCAGANYAYNNKINMQAVLLGRKLAREGVCYVQGGCEMGLMGLTLRGFMSKSSNFEIFVPEHYYRINCDGLEKMLGKYKDKISTTKGEGERLKRIIACDEIVVMPGGLGTLEEFLYSNETKRALEHDKKITIVNIDGFYNGFLSQIEQNKKEGLTKDEYLHFEVVSSVEELSFKETQTTQLEQL